MTHDLGAAIDLLPEYRLMSIELCSHLRVLRRLPGKQKGQPALAGRSRRGTDCRLRGQRLPQLLARPDNRGKPHRKMRSARSAGQANVGPRRLLARKPGEATLA